MLYIFDSVYQDAVKRKQSTEEFSANCPHKGKECLKPIWDNLNITLSHCDQCYDEGKYNIQNGRNKNGDPKYVNFAIHAELYKEELAKNCRFGKESGENSKTCDMKDFLEICKYCKKKFTR